MREPSHDACRVTLPSGREVALRPLTAEDEAFVLERGDRPLPVRLVTELLARCLDSSDARVATLEPRALTVGDREALLLHVRRLTLGDDLSCTLACPAPACGQRMAIELRASDLLLTPYPDAQSAYDTRVSREGATYEIRFRLPTGEDQELAAELAREDAPGAALLVLDRCVQRVTVDGRETAARDLPTEVVDAISAAIADRDPQAELDLAVTCPECGAAVTALFDTASYFLRELEDRAARLLREVHTLALYYHWSERDILEMPPRRRQRYLTLLAETLSPPSVASAGESS
jgi:hypothetical protein